MSNEAATSTTRYASVADHLLARSLRVGDCMRWQGPHTPAGYGCFSAGGRTHLVHRLAYQEWVGPIPEGKQLDHLCRVRDCIEVKHMEPVTSRENTLRGVGPSAMHAKATHCPHGHEYTPENTILTLNRTRKCRECDLAYKRTRVARAYAKGMEDGRKATVERIRAEMFDHPGTIKDYDKDGDYLCGCEWGHHDIVVILDAEAER